MKNLINQKIIVKNLANTKKESEELSSIKFNTNMGKLQNEVKKLQMLDKYDYLSTLIFADNSAYLSQLEELSILSTTMIQDLNNSYISMGKLTDSMLEHSITLSQKKSTTMEIVALILFILSLVTTIVYRRKLNLIDSDISFLYSIDKNSKDYKFFSQEAQAIELRMSNKPTIIKDDPTMIDKLTQLKNYKGMIHSYNNKKNRRSNFFTSVTIFEIDNFTNVNNDYSQEFVESVVKKIAFCLSLHEQATDTIAITARNQFSIILSRASKEQSFKDIETIHKAISALKFDLEVENSDAISVSGGFVIKQSSQHLDDSIKKAKEVLNHAKLTSQNSISQIQDLR